MRQQRKLEEQAEAVRKSRVAVTVDLLGRRVGEWASVEPFLV
jgi:hypothetical protein